MANGNAGTIKVETIEDLTSIIAGIVKEGLIFKCSKDGDAKWEIELTGGF